jgi:hypothetical protein
MGTFFTHTASLGILAPVFGDTYHRAQAAYLGSLIFMASAAPSFISQVVTEKRPLDTVAVGVVSRVFETVGPGGQCRADVRRGGVDQRDWNIKLQGRRLPWQLDLYGQRGS